MIPKIVKRKILISRKPSGLIQYTITIPKEYAEKLTNQGKDSLIVVFNHGLLALPVENELTESAIMAFLKTHTELGNLFNSHENPKENFSTSTSMEVDNNGK